MQRIPESHETTTAAAVVGVGLDALAQEGARRPLPPPQRSPLDRAEAAARANLGDAEFEAVWAAGQTMTLDQAVEQARSVTVPPTSALPTEAPSSGAATPSSLSRREHEVATLVAEGLSNPQIATRLGLSDRTIDAHLRNIMGKLEVASRAQVAVWSVRQRLTVPPDL